ncbi:MAG: nucleotidyltransferase domain-containing protein [Chloroflexi bacterium]|nr:nucleotidyltransferase domain-containing protein [Chloroflexota bacterium]
MKVERLTQLKPQERAALAEYLDRLRARFADRVLKVILYGSRARGEGDDESDLDVLVVVDEGDWKFHDEVAFESCDPSINHSVAMSPLVWNEAFYEEQRRWELLFFRNLQLDGIQLWIRPRKSRRSDGGSNGQKTTLRRRA